MAEKSLEITVQELVDREAIRDLPQRYCHYVWKQDVPAVVSLFTQDGEFDAGRAQPTAKGTEALREAYKQGLAALDPRPFIHNHVIDLDGDHATGTCYLELRATQDGQSVIAAGHYDDVYAKVDGEWKFRSRKFNAYYFVPLKDGWAEHKG